MKNVIKDLRTGKIYFDDGIIRNFEELLEENISFDDAKKKYPNIIKV
ncbi:hypothetical protein [uncultured Winogradskyella sp.]|nr:hypothetical protein [uncultured Winogradskyella sp.]